MQFNGDKKSTRFLESNILNLGYMEFPQENEYGVPMLHQTNILKEDLISTPITGFNFCKTTRKNRNDIGVHFFLHDYQFERVWQRPDRYLDLLKQFKFVLSPDFSQYDDMPYALKLYNVYRNRWCGRFWQEYGITVIPTVTWSNNEDIDYQLEGIPQNSVIAVSTMGEGRWGNYQSLKSRWNYVVKKLNPSIILLYGKDLSKELEGNIVYKKIISSKVVL